MTKKCFEKFEFFAQYLSDVKKSQKVISRGLQALDTQGGAV